jgi:hypothetical protein
MKNGRLFRVASSTAILALSMFCTATPASTEELQEYQCRQIANHCINYYEAEGYDSAVQCFDAYTINAGNTCTGPSDPNSTPEYDVYEFYGVKCVTKSQISLC